MKKLLSLTPIALLLGACATTNSSVPAIAVKGDGGATSTKSSMSAPMPSSKANVQYVPVPLPGQLMPVPVGNTDQTAAQKTFKTPQDAVDYANKTAQVLPTSSDFFNAIATYPFTPGAEYVVYTAPGRITDVTLQASEKLVSEAAGDTLRWQVGQTYSGNADTQQQHILIKPNQPNLDSNMIITTDQRVYHLHLISTANTYMASVQWTYPTDMVTTFNADDQGLMASSGGVSGINAEALNFNYTISMLKTNKFLGSGKPSWYPVRVFDDGKKTYIELPDDYGVTQLPMLLVADDSGVYSTMVNWRFKKPYMIADVVFDKAHLQSGVESDKSDTVVEITRTKAS